MKRISLCQYSIQLALCLVLLWLSPVADATAGYVCFNSPDCADPPSSMVAWWPLDEDSGTTAEDIAGGNNGSHVGDPSPALGKVCNALHFDGVDDRIAAFSPCHSFDELTVDAWIKLDTLPEVGESYAIASSKGSALPFSFHYFVGVRTESSGEAFLRFLYCDCHV